MTALLLAWCSCCYFAAGLAINIGYHRVLSHRSFRLWKPLEYVFVTLGLPAGTPLQWAGNHRQHHAKADLEGDPHSPVRDGFWFAHCGWYIRSRSVPVCLLYALGGPLRNVVDAWQRPRNNREYDTHAPDVAQDRYYAWVSRPVPYLACTLAHTAAFYGFSYAVWGWTGFFAFWATMVVTFNLGDAIDSVSHLFGDRAYAQSPHHARNHWFMGVFTLGEGWHANHHEFPRSARHGLLPGQADWTYGIVRLLARLGLAWDIRLPTPEEVRERLAWRPKDDRSGAA